MRARRALAWIAQRLLHLPPPSLNGELALPGLIAPVIIRRDRWGIPHITAQNDHDAWFAFGFCQGQDRAFQLECVRRIVHGRLAEIVGPRALPIDRIARRVGFIHSAERHLAALSTDVRAQAEAFVAGLNAGLRPTLEFRLLRMRPGLWTPADVLAMVKLFSFVLASNWTSELVRLLILAGDGPEALAALDPAGDATVPVTRPPGALAGQPPEWLTALTRQIPAMSLLGRGGSNNWVVAGSRTASGRPLLANDPHLDPVIPSYWYLGHLKTPDWAVAGAALIGTPAFAAGHNGFAAWGVTAGLSDNTDLFIEEIGPDGRSVRQGDKFVPCSVRVERIAVRGAAPVDDVVLETPRGPVISPALPGIPWALSLRAVWLDPLPIDGLLRLAKVRSFDEFRAAFAAWPHLPLNVVYADVTGVIGWLLAGQVPQRRPGDGLLPRPGWEAGAGWDALLPAEALPWIVNPPEGFLATANNPPQPWDAEPFLGVDFLDGYRVARIREILTRRTDWDVTGLQLLQLDQYSLPWRDVRDVVLAIPAPDPAAARGLTLLRAWDGVLSPDSPAATVFTMFWAELARRVAEAKAPHTARWVLGQSVSPFTSTTSWADRRVAHLVHLLREQPAGWFERSWPSEMADALATVVRQLEERYGPDPWRWRWGRVRPLVLQHPLGVVPLLRRLLNRGPLPWGGDQNTIAAGGVNPLDPLGPVTFFPSLRLVIDVGDWDATRVALPGGQSGDPLSPQYDDQLAAWYTNRGVPLAWSDEAVTRVTTATLMVRPAATASSRDGS